MTVFHFVKVLSSELEQYRAWRSVCTENEKQNVNKLHIKVAV